jgi:hypothetical protein
MARVDGIRARITAATVGVAAAISVAVSMLWFSIGFVLYEPVLQARWRGMPTTRAVSNRRYTLRGPSQPFFSRSHSSR